MSKDSKSQAARDQAYAKVMETFVPQMFGSPKILTQGATDSGDVDIWMMTNMPADILIPLTGLQMIAEVDKRDDIQQFVQYVLRGLKGINGFQTKTGERMAIGMSGGMGKKTVKKPGWSGRNITHRNWAREAEEEGAEIET